MKRKTVLALVAVLAMTAGVSRADRIDLDLHDYDDELMRNLEQTLKYFEPDISDGNLTSYPDDVQLIQYAFSWVKAYFEKKGPDGARGVAIAQQGLDQLAAIDVDVKAKNFSAAADKAHAFTPICRSCHDIYKPNLAR
jgi:hypothetical protein